MLGQPTPKPVNYNDNDDPDEIVAVVFDGESGEFEYLTEGEFNATL